MMDFDYAAQHLRGVWRLAAGDENWRQDMDLTLDGFFRSLWAMALAIPFALLGFTAAARAIALTPEYPRTMFSKAPLGVLLGIEVLTMIIAWFFSIAILAFSAKRIGASKQAAGLIVTFNWSQLLGGMVAVIPAIALIASGSLELFAILAIPALIFNLFLAWSVIRKNLAIDIGVTIAILAIIIAAEIGVNSVITRGGVWVYQLLS